MDEETKRDHRDPSVLGDATAARLTRKPSPLPDPLTQQKNLLRFLEEMEKLPVQTPDDGFSGRDHDTVLYPRRG